MNFKTVSEFINWLIENEGIVLKDNFGRKWKYEKYKFYFQDISASDFSEKISCLHLFSTIKNPSKI